MENYCRNTEKVLDYLVQKQACRTLISATRNCYRQLKLFLEEKGAAYSKDQADQWLAAVSDKYVRQTISFYRNALDKLSDVYAFGEVRHLTRFKSDGTYYGLLCEALCQQLEDFLASLSAEGMANATLLNYRGEVSRIFYRLMTKYGITDMRDLSYGDIIGFYNTDSHEGHSAKRYANEIFTKVLCYFHNKGLFPFGYTIIIHHLSLGKGTYWNNVSRPVMDEILNLQKEQDNSYPLEEFRTAQVEIIRSHLRENYSKGTRCAYNKWMDALYLFLEMNGLAYSAGTSWMWYAHVFTPADKERRTARRALCLIEQRIVSGKTDLDTMFLEKPNAFSRLPGWCRPDVGKFLDMKASEGWSASTLCMYRSSVCRFCMFLDARHITSFSKITAIDIKAFNREDRHDTPSGKNAYNVRIRKFLYYLGETGRLQNPMLFAALPSVSAPKETLVVILSGEELETIKQAIYDDPARLTLREKAMLLLGLRMGMRSSDIVGLLLDDIDWDRVSLRFIQKKTNVEVTLPISMDVANALYRYLIQERPQTESRNVFIRKRAPYRGTGRNTCREALLSALPERDVPGSGFHVTRKTYASSLLAGGAGIDMVTEALGQKGTGSLHRYLSLDEERMRMCPLGLAGEGLLMEGGF